MSTKKITPARRRRKSMLKVVEAQDLFKSIPHELLERIGEETKVDSNVSRLYGKLMLQLLALGMLEGNRTSTRLLAEVYNTRRFKIITDQGSIHQTRHSSIAERLSHIKAEYFESIFYWMYDKYKSHLPKSKLGKQITAFDSTMVKISSALVDYGMKVGSVPKSGPRQHQIKFTTQIHNGLPKKVKVFTDQKHLSEQTALREVIKEANIQPGDIVVFDAGLTDRATFVEFDRTDIQFVTRLKSNYRDEKMSVHRQIEGRIADGLEFGRDDRVKLYASGNEVVDHEFRLVEVHNRSNCEVITFVTNIWDLSAMDIARIYRQRWDIEVMFRFLKQEMSFSHLINRSQNGILVQMYAALIAAIMLIVYKVKNKIETFGTAKLRFMDELFFAASQEAQLKFNSWDDS